LALTETDSKLFTLAVEMSQDGIVIGNAITGEISYINKAIMKMLEIKDKNSVNGKSILDFVADFDRERALKNSLESVKNCQGWKGQFFAKKNNGELLPIELTATPIKDENGALLAYIDIVRDVSDTVKTERTLKDAQRKLELANEKLLVLGGIVRHDIGNKMSALNANAYLARKRGSLEQLLQAVADAYSKVNRVLEFSKDYELLGKEQLCYVDTGKVFDEALGLFTDFNFRVVNQCSGLTVLADSLLREVFYNLLDNTVKYGRNASQVKLSYVQEEGGLSLVYEDDGLGIPKTMKLKLFTKGYGQGSGLGLYLIKKTLEVYGWQITETGIEGKNARFKIIIPKEHYKLSNST
jgi:PAS domain S-box-containing protein